MNQKLAHYLTPIVALFFATALGVTASSTIGTDISTGGDLDVTGTTTTGVLLAGGWLKIFDDGGTPAIDTTQAEGDIHINNTADGSDGGGNIILDAVGGGSVRIDASGGGDIQIEPSGGGVTSLSGAVRFVPQTSGPVACAAGTRGVIAYGNASNQLCFCDGSQYVLAASTTVACQFDVE